MRNRKSRILSVALLALALTLFPAGPGPASGRTVVDEPHLPLTGDGLPASTDEDGPVVPAGTSSPPALELRSPSAVLVEALSGQVLYEKEADKRYAPASLTKIMTLLLAAEAIEEGRLSLTDKVIASENAESYGGTQIWLEPGEEMPVEEIILAIAVASANDASVALAEHLCGSEEEFVELMNERAAELGLTNTHFGNSHGLDVPGQYTSARDMAILSCAAARYPTLLQFTGIYETHIRPGDETWLVNRNRMVHFYQGCDGLKTGWTQEAGYSLAATAARGGTRFVAVTLGAAAPGDRFADATKMLNWAFANYVSLRITEKGQPYGTVAVDLGVLREVEAVAPETQGVLLEKGTEGEVERELVFERIVRAPVRRGDPVGAVVVRRAGEELGRWPLVADRDVAKVSFLGLWWRLFARVLGGG